MRITRVRIHSFRSIRDLALECQPLMVLLGPNNHGKSNLLAAIEFVLSTSSKPSPDDFFSLRQVGENDLWVEIEFTELTAQEKITFKRYVNGAGGIKIRKTARIGEGAAVDVSYHGHVSEPTEWWLRSDAVDKLTKRDEVEKAAQTIPALNELLQEKGKIFKKTVEEFQSTYIEQNRGDLSFDETLETSPLLGTKNVAGGVLPDFYLVPAVRDLSDETKVKATTTFGKLLQRAVQEMALRDPQFVELRGKLDALIKTLNATEGQPETRPTQLAAMEAAIAAELKPWGVKVAIEINPPELERIFELGTRLHLDDGLKTLAEQKGHGLQRAVVFALLRAWARALRAAPAEGEALAARKASESVVFAIEEPELFLHPHAQRRLASAIRDISETAEHQVFLCTHSTHFVDLDQHKSIAIISKESSQTGTTARQCTVDLFQGEGAKERRDRFHMASWINPDRGEIFFARKVVLVEGETDAATLAYLGTKLDCFDTDVSVVDCGSKHNLPLYVALLNAFQIPYVVVHDEDPLPDPIPAEWSGERKAAAQRAFAANEEVRRLVKKSLGKVEMLSPNFETVAGVSKSQGEKKGKAVAALDYFQGLEVAAIPPRLQELVRAAFAGPDVGGSGEKTAHEKGPAETVPASEVFDLRSGG